jgi:RND family efflux transporter MFP subunit
MGMLLSSVAAIAAETEDAATTLDCVINPSVVADLGSAVPGVLSDVRVDRSDFVERGTVLAELESGAEAATVELARARASLTSEVELRRANAAFGNRQHERTKDLFERKVLSTNEMDERQTEARVANIQLRQALDNQRLARLEQIRAEEVLSRRVIQSPITGVVMERFKSVGEYVEDQPVVRVAQLDPLHVEVIVPVEQLGKIRPGMQAEIWSEVVADTAWKATVSRVDRVADVASGTYGVRLSLPNPDHRIPAGLRCRMSWLEQSAEPVAGTDPAGEETANEESAGINESTVAGPVEVTAPPGGLPEPQPLPLQAAVDDAVAPELLQGATSQAAMASVEARMELPRCRVAGPFDSRAVALTQARALREQGLTVALETHRVPTRQGFQIVSGPLPDRTAADRLVARLKAAGITDYFVKGRTQPPLEVALGLYNGESGATRRAEALRAKGFDVKVEPWLKEQARAFLAISGVLDETAVAALDVLPQPDPGLLPAEAACDDRLAGR